jgi:hypothetical protein
VFVQARVPGLEVIGKPAFYLAGKFLIAEVGILFIVIHDVAQFIKQPFMVCLVFGILVIILGPHDFFFQRKVCRNMGVDFAKEIHHGDGRILATHGVMQIIDKIYYFLMFVIDIGDAYTELIFPLNQYHDSLTKAGIRPWTGESRLQSFAAVTV